MSMRRYRVYGLVIESEIELSSVETMDECDGPPSIRMVLGPVELFRAVPLRPPGDDDWIQQGVLADGSIHVKVEGVFETIVSPDGRQAACARLGTTDDRSFEANLLNFVVATALTLQGEEPLHATVVDFGDVAVGLLGGSGAGKSTLAACLIAQGARLVTDDMLRLGLVEGKALAYPGPHRLKLFDEPARRFLPDAEAHGWLNALSGKRMIEPTPMHGLRQCRRLGALFWLGGDGDAGKSMAVRRLMGAELARCLIASAMNFRYHAPERLARQLRFCERIARILPVYALDYPRTFEMMDRVSEEIRRVVRA
ncbi:MAG: hypothetical protein KIT25_20320 [Enhydrobacter sp.]|nr:MAG: hypothetical protein KIT25_20320 [Enhydrobacter sp.]